MRRLAAAPARVARPAADVGGIPLEGGVEAAYKRQLEEAADPAVLRSEIKARIESARVACRSAQPIPIGGND